MSIDPDITTTAGEFDGPKIVDFFTHQRDDVPNVTLVDCGPRHVGTPPSKRPGQTWDAARAAHKYAMSAPDHELVMVVGKRASVTWQVNAVVEVAAEVGVKLTGRTGNVLTWPNGARLRVETKDSRGIVPVHLMGLV